jgi:hypothetical protein
LGAGDAAIKLLLLKGSWSEQGRSLLWQLLWCIVCFGGAIKRNQTFQVQQFRVLQAGKVLYEAVSLPELKPQNQTTLGGNVDGISWVIE